MTLFPDRGLPLEVVLDGLAAGAHDHDAVRSGPASFSLEVNADLQRVIRAAFDRYLTHNPVFGEALPSLARIERELVAMGAEICGGGPEATGSVTLGGSESIFTALHAARERARACGQDGPYEVVASETIHPAHAKACHYLGLRLVGVPYRDDLRADVDAMAAAITPATIAVCASAPQWPHHRFDDVEAIAALALERSLWCHVDACVGGYLAPFVRAAGWPVPAYDFSVPGVCSMSADLHKWGYAAKPASTVLFADGELAHWAPPPPVPWDCGTYATGSVAGSRPGASVAAAWAVLRFLGRDGFTDLAARTMTVRDRIVAGLDAIDGIRTRSTDLAMVIYGGADGVDSNALGDALVRRGWLVMRLVRPEPMLQLLIDRLEDEFVEVFLGDVAAAVTDVRASATGRVTDRAAGSYG
jgi:sphinganine-1-phosphate aldolase